MGRGGVVSSAPSTQGTQGRGREGQAACGGGLGCPGGRGGSVHPSSASRRPAPHGWQGPRCCHLPAKGLLKVTPITVLPVLLGGALVAAAEATPVAAGGQLSQLPGPARAPSPFPGPAGPAAGGAHLKQLSTCSGTWSRRGQGIFSARIEATALQSTAWPCAHRLQCPLIVHQHPVLLRGTALRRRPLGPPGSTEQPTERGRGHRQKVRLLQASPPSSSRVRSACLSVCLSPSQTQPVTRDLPRRWRPVRVRGHGAHLAFWFRLSSVALRVL